MTGYARRLDAMVRRAAAGGNVAIHGGPGSGKTRTTRLVVERLANRPGQRCVAIDLSTVDSGAEVFAALASHLGAPLKRGETSLHDAWLSVQRLRQDAPSATCLVLDEFDSAIDLADSDTFLRHLRELVHAPAISGVTAIVASRRNIRVIEEAVRGISTLEGVFAPFYLGTLCRRDIADGWNVELSEGAWGDLLEWTGGVPRLVDLYLSSFAENEAVSADAHLARQEWIERELDYLASVGLGEAAAQHILGPIIERSSAARARLLAMGLIGGGGEEGLGRPLAEFKPFVASLRQRNADARLAWGALGDAEMAARRLSRAVLESTGLGDGTRAESPAVVAQVLDASRSVLTDRGVEPPMLTSVVGGFGRGDHWAVLEALWPEVGSLMSPPDPAYWRLRLAHLGGVGSSPGEQWDVDLPQVAQWAQEIGGGHALLDRRLGVTEVRHELAFGDVHIMAGSGSTIGVGSRVDNSHAAAPVASTAGEKSGFRLWGQRIAAAIGVAGGLATVITLVYYIVDR